MTNPNRADDKFMRNVIFFLITFVAAQGGGWVWTVAVLYSDVQKIRVEHETMMNSNLKLAIIERDIKYITEGMQGIKQEMKAILNKIEKEHRK